MTGDPNLSDYSNEIIIQRFALACLYMAITGGDLFTVLSSTWMTYTPLCTWTDGLCNSDDVPRNINLLNLDLKGTLAPELGMLSNEVTFIEVGQNNIKGTIPTEFGLLTELTRLRSHSNSLTGTLPTQLGNLNKVGMFVLSSLILLVVVFW